MKNPKIVFISEGLEELYVISRNIWLWFRGQTIIPRVKERVHFRSAKGIEKSWEVLDVVYMYSNSTVRITVK